MPLELTNLTSALWDAAQKLKIDSNYIKGLAVNKATTERNYKKALACKILELKAEKYPATLIGDLCRGDDGVAEHRFNRDLAKALYDVAKSEQRSAEVQISALQSILRVQKEI